MRALKIILFCIVFVLCYLILYKVYIANKAKRLEKSNKIIQLKLTKIEIIFSSIMFAIALYTYKSLIHGVLFGVFAYAIPKLYESLIKKSEKKKTLMDLLNIIESLNVQISSNMPLKLVLKNLPDICKYSRFKNMMTDLYLEYQLTGFSLTKSLRRLKEKFPYTEISMFASALEQHARGNNSAEAYNNLILVLKEKNIEYIENITESKTTILVIGVVIILINLLIMGCYPVIIEVSDNLDMLLR